MERINARTSPEAEAGMRICPSVQNASQASHGGRAGDACSCSCSCPTTAILEAPRAPASLACQASCLDATLTSERLGKARGNFLCTPCSHGQGWFCVAQKTPFVLASSHRARIHSGVRGPSAVEVVFLRTRWAPKTCRGSRFAGGQERPGAPKRNDPATRPRRQAAILTRLPAHYHRQRDDSLVRH